MDINTNMTKEEQEAFEKQCIALIEKIILLDYNQDRKGASEVAKKMLEDAKAKFAGKSSKKIDDALAVFKRVYDEFVECTEQEYAILKKQLFSGK